MAPREYVMVSSGQWAQLREDFAVAQAHRCAICQEPLRDYQVLDHDHVTGFVRGVLCGGCNPRLGWYEQNRRHIEAYLARAAYYDAHSLGITAEDYALPVVHTFE